ncbi:MAG TPA: hypothetical protein VL326_33130 [Kofleriaceae bacterium]|jgi:hypothetical protein|nr:hypothetical protein [Kofleriaceae bacterium]
MRALAAALVFVCALSATAHSEPLPPGTIGPVFGALSGTGADAKRIGYGLYPFGLQASWQPMTTERTMGWTLRWSTMFGRLYSGSAAQISDVLLTVQMDLLVGLRYRPWSSPRRYLTLRAGGEVLRSNQPIPRSSDDDTKQRNFLGAVAAVGYDQYFGGLFMWNVDVRFSVVGSGPSQASVLVGIGFTGP